VTSTNSGNQFSNSDAVTVQAGPPEIAVTTHHNDAFRSGWNPHEQILTATNVAASGSFGPLYSIPLDDQVDAQPLVVPHRTILGSIHDAAYVVTANNTIYAIEPATGTVLLSRNLGTPRQWPSACHNNSMDVGIEGTPVIDSVRNTMYLIAQTVENSVAILRIHALSLSSLNDTVPAVQVAATHQLLGGSQFAFSAHDQRQRPALLEANGNIYAAFGSYCDKGGGNSRGWLLGWTADALQPLAADQSSSTHANSLTNTQTTPMSFYLSSIWMSGSGPAADASGNVYFVTGNTSDPNHDATNNISESVARLSPDLTTLLNLFTDQNYVSSLDQNDEDLGSGGVILLPDQVGTSPPHLAVTMGKLHGIYLLNRDDMSNVLGAPIDIAAGCWCGESYFVGADGLGRVVTSAGRSAGENGGIHDGRVILWLVVTSPTRLARDTASANLPTGQESGFFTSVSSNGTQAGTAVIWAVTRPTDTNPANVTLYALNPTDGSVLFSAIPGNWMSGIGGSADIVPTVANGLVLVATDQRLQIYGLQ